MAMKRMAVFDTKKEGYWVDQLQHLMTVKELKKILDDLRDEDMIVISHDNGYTFGSIKFNGVWEEHKGEEETYIPVDL